MIFVLKEKYNILEKLGIIKNLIYIMDGNVSNINHFIHFIIGIISYKFNFITGIFILYQLIDGFKFNYKVVRFGDKTDDIPLDFFFFCIGNLLIRYIIKIYNYTKI